jgi:hypothetical protein
MSDRLIGIRAKIERAKQHVRDLEIAVQAFRNTNLYGFQIEDDLQTGEKIHRVHIRSQTPDDFSLMIGDAVHNLRSALDHLAWQLVEANGNPPGKGTYFPISETLTKYIASKGAKIQGMSAGAESLIDSIKPYLGGNDDLWKLQELDNFDKHRLLLVTAYALSAVMPTWRTTGEGVSPYVRLFISSLVSGYMNIDPGGVISPQRFLLHAPVGIQPDGTLPILQDGAEVGRMKPPLQDECKFDLAFEIAFREPAVVKGQPVIPFAHQLTHLVGSIVDQFIPFL